MNTKLVLTSSFTLTLLYSTSAYASSAGCTQVNHLFFATSFIGETFTSDSFTVGETITLTADSITSDAYFSNNAAFNLLDGSSSVLAGPFVYSIAGTFALSGLVSETLVVPDGGFVGLRWAEDIDEGGFWTEFVNLSISCETLLSTLPLQQSAQINTAGQQRAMNSAMSRNTSSRLAGANTNTVTKNAFFVSTQNLTGDTMGPLDLNFWAALDTRAYFDGYEGYSADLVLGADYQLNSNTLFGIMVSAGTSDLDGPTNTSTKSDSLTFGGYGAYRFAGSNITLDGYVAIGKVDYETDTQIFDTDRYLAGLSVSGTYEVTSGVISPRVRLWHTKEDFPSGALAAVGGTTRQSLLSIGTGMDWSKPILNTGLRPSASFDVEYRSIEEIGGVSDNFFAPRVGVGLEGQIGGGAFSASLDAGRSASDVTDVGLVLSYQLTF